MRRLELNSIYEISRLLISTVELDKVLELIINSLIIIYKIELSFIGLREGDKIKIIQAKGEYGQLLVGKVWSIVNSGFKLTHFQRLKIDPLWPL
ncbi:hypothetical protein [Fervidicola ferrireducens]|uniref:hypothetical protein n=1 Tax=Fervidicola ferrireducens TaxID=520764 RepID=UPI001CA39FCC|nr:hypothetical protein [Fervidicola ferrireducens]